MTSENKMDFHIIGPLMSTILTDAKLLKNNSLSTIRKFFGIFITGFLLIMSFLLIFGEIIAIKNSYDLPSFANCMNPICFHLSGSIKWILGIIQIDEIEELIDGMKCCHRLCLKINENDKDYFFYRTKMKKLRRKISTFSYCYLFLLIYGVIQWCLNPIFYDLYNDIYRVNDTNSNFARHLPYPGVYPWKIDDISKYIGTFIFQTISTLGSAIGHGVYDTATINFFLYACYHIEYLNNTLNDERNNISLMSDNLAVLKLKNKLQNCVRHHRKILMAVDKLTQNASIPVFVICSQTTISLCLVSLEASTMTIDSSIESIMTVTSLIEFWIGININLFIYCYIATKIKELGLDTANAIYLCGWEQVINSLKIKYKYLNSNERQSIKNINQMIQISMMRAQKPIIIYGGLFYILSLETYKALAGFSLSNAIVLRQVIEE